MWFVPLTLLIYMIRTPWGDNGRFTSMATDYGPADNACRIAADPVIFGRQNSTNTPNNPPATVPSAQELLSHYIDCGSCGDNEEQSEDVISFMEPQYVFCKFHIAG